ncbi:Wzz/FepE/Etk N-terminal domain-containing protein [Halospina sp. K52047b]|uniref:Wzz/FepE/Etk N-terminal domain-containing protein n=1 Tax=Halospina sp. K52047b TaxID=2614160 RepID=UPI00178851E6|nr:Wzz/FepE/Etk N-terminal domain-containing protein [Halospina sp. K52047b]
MHDDEIDLVDLARALIRRRWVIIGTFLACTLGAAFYAFSQERVYAFTTSIELGEFGPQEYVASASGTKNTIEERILLSAKRAYLKERDLESMPFDVSVSTAEESSFVNLVTEAPLDEQETVAEFHDRIYKRLRDEHQSRLSILEEESDAKLKNLRGALEAEQRRMKVLEGLSVNSTEQAGNGDTQAQALAGEDVRATLASSDAALTLLLSQLQLNERISEREERINEIQSNLREEQTRRSWIKPTRAEDLAIASLNPVGTSRALILVLGALLGGMLGVFMAFFVEFAARVREAETSS